MPDDVNKTKEGETQTTEESANSTQTVSEVVEQHEVQDPMKAVLDAIAASDRKAEERHQAHERRLLDLEAKGKESKNGTSTTQRTTTEGQQATQSETEGPAGAASGGSGGGNRKRSGKLKLWRTF